MLAKRFFFVCAGLLCLAAAYHLGASGAIAQSPGDFASSISGNGSTENFTYVVGRTMSVKYDRRSAVTILPVPVPGTSAIVATGVIAGGFVAAMLANGDTYTFQPTVSSSWEYVGNMLDVPTPVQPSTFGEVKVRYR